VFFNEFIQNGFIFFGGIGMSLDLDQRKKGEEKREERGKGEKRKMMHGKK
jgi:hypothetical protein